MKKGLKLFLSPQNYCFSLVLTKNVRVKSFFMQFFLCVQKKRTIFVEIFELNANENP